MQRIVAEGRSKEEAHTDTPQLDESPGKYFVFWPKEAFGVFLLGFDFGSSTDIDRYPLGKDTLACNGIAVDPHTRIVESPEEGLAIFETPRHAINFGSGLLVRNSILCRLKLHSRAVKNLEDLVHPNVWTQKAELISIIPLNLGRNRELSEKAARAYEVPLEKPSLWTRLVAWNLKGDVDARQQKSKRRV